MPSMSSGKQRKLGTGTATRSEPFFGRGSPQAEQPFVAPEAVPRESSAQQPTKRDAIEDVKLAIDSPVADQLGANAFTQGDTIHFAPGKFRPETAAGRALVAHELTHIAQQREGRVQPTTHAHGLPINRDDSLEGEARRAGEAAASGAPVPIMLPPTASAGASASPVVQGEFAIEPTVANPVIQELTAEQVDRALRHNRAAFTDADEIEQLRMTLGGALATLPAVIDEDFVRAIGSYQASYGLNQDGVIGAATARQLASEFEAEAASVGAADAEVSTGTEMAIAPTARRLRLRAQVRRRLGLLTTQAFVGNRLSPAGVVTTRANDRIGGQNNLQSNEYTGAGGATAQWLQFGHHQVFGFAPASNVRVNLPGDVPLADQPDVAVSIPPGVINWHVDSSSAVSPFYGPGFLDNRVGNSYTMFDRPGGPAANAFAAGFAASRAPALNRVRIIQTFEAYLVRGNRVQHRVSWTATSVFTITAGVATGQGPFFNTSDSSAAAGLRAPQRAALDARYPGNGIL